MQNGFSILLLWFSVGLFIYAGLTALTKKLIIPYRKRHAFKNCNNPTYAVRFAKIMAIVACSPLLAGGLGLLFDSPAVAGIVFVAATVAAIVIATRIVKNADGD